MYLGTTRPLICILNGKISLNHKKFPGVGRGVVGEEKTILMTNKPYPCNNSVNAFTFPGLQETEFLESWVDPVL